MVIQLNFYQKKLLKKALKFLLLQEISLSQKKNIHYLSFYDSNNVSDKLISDNIISTIPPNEVGTDPIITKYGQSITKNKNRLIKFFL